PLFNNVVQVELRAPKQKGAQPPVVLQPACVRTVGFERDEGMLPYTDRSFMGYRLLQEFFTFPEKFLFFDLCGLDRAAAAGVADVLELRSHFDREFPLESAVSAQTFRLNCTPILQLLQPVDAPIPLAPARKGYPV